MSEAPAPPPLATPPTSIQFGLPGLDASDLPRTTAGLESAWAEHRPPAGYTEQYRRLAAAAVEADLHPHDLDSPAFAGSALERLATRRGWKPATISLYAKVARYAGIPCPAVSTPEPNAAALSLAPLLAHPGERATPATIRVWVWLTLARQWPAPLPIWTRLRAEHLLLSSGHRQLTIAYQSGTHLGRDLRTPADPAAAAWAGWLRLRETRPALAASPWALPNTRPGNRPDVTIGSQPSARGLEAAFQRYLRRTMEQLRVRGTPPDPTTLARYLALNYDTYRRHVMATRPAARTAVGLLDLEPGPGARGIVRAERSRPRRHPHRPEHPS